MQIGSQLHTNSTHWDQVQDVVRVMDDGPWESVWVPDHLVSPLAFLDELAGRGLEAEVFEGDRALA